MTAEAFYQECQKRNIRLWLTNEDQLGYAGPPPELTPPVVDAIAFYKDGLVNLLRFKYVKPKFPEHVQDAPPWRPLDLFEDADLVQLSYDWEDQQSCESRVGSDLVTLTYDHSPLGFFNFSKQGLALGGGMLDKHRLCVYRQSEVEALRKLGITADGPSLHNYHADKCALFSVWDSTRWYARSGKAAGSTLIWGTWAGLVQRAEELRPGFSVRAEAVLQVLIEGKHCYESKGVNTGKSGGEYTAVRAGRTQTDLFCSSPDRDVDIAGDEEVEDPFLS